MAGSADPLFYAVRDLDTGQIGGMLSFLRIFPEAGSIELGHINFAPRLQRTRAATEAMMLTIGWAFEAGYRRFEWKCDALNLPSRRAAERLGLSYEGVFRQATVYKGRNRDTAWFAAIDAEWPALRAAYGAWLAPAISAQKAGRLRRLGSSPCLFCRSATLGWPSVSSGSRIGTNGARIDQIAAPTASRARTSRATRATPAPVPVPAARSRANDDAAAASAGSCALRASPAENG